jgi:molybdopterin converting factor small subunit
MRITVKLGAPLSQVIGETKVSLNMTADSTVADVLDALQARHPDFEDGLRGKGLAKPLDRVLYSLFLNSRPVSFEAAATTPLRDGDRVYLFLPVAGG